MTPDDIVDLKRQFNNRAFPVLFPLYLMQWSTVHGKGAPYEYSTVTVITYGYNRQHYVPTTFVADLGPNFSNNSSLASWFDFTKLKTPLGPNFQDNALWMYSDWNHDLNQYALTLDFKPTDPDLADRILETQDLLNEMKPEAISWDEHSKIVPFPEEPVKEDLGRCFSA
ncbi:hypothetical protein M422DRAFT_65587 [Sphaerobolus stellatus SS14]|nr:hypothetical protein M422DRAFT_65587 [Sphaerobolus stellatus SS14]